MKIALFTETFLPKIDGVVNTLCQLLQHLERRGHEAVVLAPGNGPETFASARVIYHRGAGLPMYPELRVVSPFADVGASLRGFRPDLVHVANPVLLGVAGTRWAESRGFPVVASYHTDVPGYARTYGFPALTRPLWGYLRWVHDKARLNLCPSRATLAELESRGFSNLKLWTRGVDADRFSPDKASQEWRRRLTGGNPQAPLLLYVGRLAPEKRVDWLRPLLEELPGARLAIVGGGPSREELERLFAGTPTVFPGYLQGEDLAGAYASADIFAFPSASETFGNVVLEAAASGLPAVAPRAGGVVDIVRDGETGFLFEAHSRRAFSDSVRRLVHDLGKRREMSAKARSLAEGRSWEAVLDGLLEEYHRVAGFPPPRGETAAPSPMVAAWQEDGRR